MNDTPSLPLKLDTSVRCLYRRPHNAQPRITPAAAEIYALYRFQLPYADSAERSQNIVLCSLIGEARANMQYMQQQKPHPALAQGVV